MHMFSKAFFIVVAVFGAPTFAAAETCPSFGESGTELTYDSDTVYSAQSNEVVAGGNIALADCDDVEGYGYIVENPDFTLQYDAQDRGRALEFRVEAECDAVLLINDSTANWQFNDDDTVDDETVITDPRLRLADAPSGQYDIWVGTFGEETCDATLYIESW